MQKKSFAIKISANNEHLFKTPSEEIRNACIIFQNERNDNMRSGPNPQLCNIIWPGEDCDD